MARRRRRRHEADGRCTEAISKLRSAAPSLARRTTISRLRRRLAFEITGIAGRHAAPEREFPGKVFRPYD